MNESIERSPFYLLALFIAVSLLIFFPSANAGFIFDYIGWAEQYKNGTYLQAINSFGYKGLHPVLHVVALTLTKLFGVKSVCWYVFMSTLHGLNAYVLYRFLSYILKKFNIDGFAIASLIIAILFLLHPYNIEPVVWRACIHYLISFFCIVSSLYFISKYFEEEHLKDYLLAILLYIIALFSLEISYITGILWFIVALALNYLPKFKKYSINRIIIQFLLVPISLVGVYLLLTYFKIGNAVGHYGAEKHLKFDFFDIVNNAFDYFIKYLLFARDFKFYNTGVYQKITTQPGLILVALIVFTLIIFTLLKVRSLTLKLSSVFLLLFGVALLPVLNLYFFHLLLSENDRYGYLASPFIIGSLVLFLWHFKSQLRYIPLYIYFTISSYIFFNLISAWNESEKVFSGLLKNFNSHDKKEVILLNTPDNYKGIFMFRIINDDITALNEALDVLHDKKFNGEMRSIAEFSMLRPVEKFSVISDTSNHIKVTFSDWGSWWIKNGFGATPYENDRVIFTPNGMSYDLQIKGEINPEETVILYSEGGNWKAVDIEAVKSSKPVKLNENEGVY